MAGPRQCALWAIVRLVMHGGELQGGVLSKGLKIARMASFWIFWPLTARFSLLNIGFVSLVWARGSLMGAFGKGRF